MPKNNSPWLYDVRTGQWDLRKVEGPSPGNVLASSAGPRSGQTEECAEMVGDPNVGRIQFFHQRATEATLS